LINSIFWVTYRIALLDFAPTYVRLR